MIQLPSTTAVLAAGTGPGAMLVHGLGEDHRSWRHQQLAMRDRCRTYAYDLRGHGLTPVGDGNGTLTQLGNDLIELIESLNTGPKALVGFSLGGTIALWVAANRPDLVSSIAVLGSSATVGRRAADGYRKMIELSESQTPEKLEAEVRQHVLEGTHRPPADIDALVASELNSIRFNAGYKNAATAMVRMSSQPLTPILSRITCPTIVAAGQYDMFCPFKAQKMIVEAIDGAEYVEIPGAGHLLNQDAPDALTAVIDGLMQRDRQQLSGTSRGKEIGI